MTSRHGRFLVVCAGIESRRRTLAEAEHLAKLQERRHGAPAVIYELEGVRRVMRGRSAEAANSQTRSDS